VKLGIAGLITRAFIASPLTPLLLLASLAVGAMALMALSREEEPQISVPMVDIHIRADGLKAVDAIELVTKPLETIVKGINGVEHVYTQTEDDQVIVTARFFVGTSEDTAILRVHEEIRANLDRMPLGNAEPLIVGRGINDVAVLVLTHAAEAGQSPAAIARWNDNALFDIAEKLQHELSKVPDTVFPTSSAGAPPDPRGARSRKAGTLWRHAESAHRQGAKCQPVLSGRQSARGRRRSSGHGGPDAAGRA
jgi:multidrug efflux pump subunit AcrB